MGCLTVWYVYLIVLVWITVACSYLYVQLRLHHAIRFLDHNCTLITFISPAPVIGPNKSLLSK